MVSQRGERQATGMGVDASGGAVVDPTANVKELVEAANKRTDDLRAADTKRTDDLREAEARRVNEIMQLRAYYDGLLREAEAKRIDANRAGDTNAIATLTAQVTATAAALAAATDRVTAPIIERIAALEESQNRGAGEKEGSKDTRQSFAGGWQTLVGAIVLALAVYAALNK